MNWRVPVAQPELGAREFAALSAAFRSGRISQGPQTEAFENEFAKFCGVGHAVAASSGTAAVHLALMALGAGPGDEVLSTPISCIATTNPVVLQGARLRFVDVDPATGNMDLDALEKAAGPRTRGILLVHLLGRPMDMPRVMAFAKRRRLWVIEDCCLAHGADAAGRRAGAWGDLGVFSFYANKIITSAEGGMVVSRDRKTASRLRALRGFGQDPSRAFRHPLFGMNYKLSDLHAAVGRAQLARIGDFISRRRKRTETFERGFRGVRGVAPLPPEGRGFRTVYFSYPLIFESAALRRRAESALRAAGVETRPLFSLIPDQPCYRRLGYGTKDVPRAAALHRRAIYVSNAPGLTPHQQDLIIRTVRRAVERRP